MIYDAPYHSSSNPRYEAIIARKRLALVENELPEQARIFEDGAGNGAFIRACRDAGYLADGCDLGGDAIEKAREMFAVQLRHGDIEGVPIGPNSLDLFACFNLLCHLYRPWDYMKHIASLVRPGGLWLLRTGDRSGFRKYVNYGRWSAPEHVYHFTGDLLRRMLSEAGFEVTLLTPAFDSDFPEVLSWAAQRARGPLRKPVTFAARAGYFLWERLGLPREDVYVVARKRA